MSKKKLCVAKFCPNVSDSTNKIFISVPAPAEKNKRSVWLNACGRNPAEIKNSHVYVCEDHFNMEVDCKNLAEYKSGRHKKILMNKNVIPHIFPLLKSLATTSTSNLVEEPTSVTPTSCISFIEGDVNEREHLNFCHSNVTDYISQENFVEEPIILTPTSSGFVIGEEVNEREHFNFSNSNVNDISHQPISIQLKDIGVQTDKHFKTCVPVRSKAVQTNKLDFAKHGLLANVACSPFGSPWKVTFSDSKASPVKHGSTKRILEIPSEEEELSSSSTGESCGDLSESDSCKSFEEVNNLDTMLFRNTSLLRTRKLLNMDPRVYLGILPERISFIHLLSNKFSCNDGFFTSHDAVCLIFRKIRLNESFVVLAYEFGLSPRQACRIFNRYVSFIADHVLEIIVWPNSNSLKRALPVSFRKNYSRVQSIIDCFEIEIQKPSDPVNQALTWSEYKGCNTLKYLVSITPDGLINFVSTGYGGRTTDEVVTAQSKFLEKLQPGVHVMADRGFKRIEPFISSKKCVLVRPSSVSSGVHSSKRDVIDSRRISGLRIHVERAIRRIREFSFVSPHACITNQQLKHVDDVIKIVCGLVNLQNPLIK
ncbi:uncharacterized protein LOC116923193 isoform X1 [Daphnia magna]|uniref:uncharacterized protein LOC116923193 isoform X1 n=2 Tax=Daphnia magna TaxID=35525 RepID=UPI001E1BB600|nr:uncharacterized protein LOC116923193 isoform X1 [Daphnia magna]